MQEQLSDIHTFATDAINEFRTQLREKSSADAQTVINNLQRRAVSRAGSQPPLALTGEPEPSTRRRPLVVFRSPQQTAPARSASSDTISSTVRAVSASTSRPQPNTPALLSSGKIFEHSLFQAALASNRDEFGTPMMSSGNGAPPRGPTGYPPAAGRPEDDHVNPGRRRP
ncbi:hypothetical protein GGR50DRAFT_698530 [Xylaria sp. CBS 124048]|nr:hypothetical protein GGR50DRAFT_698530 [Xylaria sp. CBS 124048]